MNKFKSNLKVQCIFQFWNVNFQRPWTFLGVLDRSLSIQRYSPFLNVSSPFLSFSVYKKVSDVHKTVENAHGTFRNGQKRSFKLSCKRSYNRSRTVNTKRLGTFVPGCNNALERRSRFTIEWNNVWCWFCIKCFGHKFHRRLAAWD